jgi:hypothetical protein
MLASSSGDSAEHIITTRDEGGSYAMIYLPMGQAVRVQLSTLSGTSIKAHWYDPRTGKSQPAGIAPKEGTPEFQPPSHGPGNDWVLVLDDAAKGYAAPGRNGKA